MDRTSSSFKFVFTKATKSWRKGKPPPCLEIREYSDDEELCVVACINEYLERSAPWRTQGQDQLLLSHMRPYNEAQSSTIANWLKLVLKMAGIDTSLYKDHSCRLASTSKAKVLGRSLKDINEVNGQGHRLGKEIIMRKS